MTFLTKTLLILLIRLYQICISPLLGPKCRFYPTCSSYAIEAIRTHGVGWGIALATRRLCKCHPWHPGGFDPVPGKAHSMSSPAASGGSPS